MAFARFSDRKALPIDARLLRRLAVSQPLISRPPPPQEGDGRNQDQDGQDDFSHQIWFEHGSLAPNKDPDPGWPYYRFTASCQLHQCQAHRCQASSMRDLPARGALQSETRATSLQRPRLVIVSRYGSPACRPVVITGQGNMSDLRLEPIGGEGIALRDFSDPSRCHCARADTGGMVAFTPILAHLRTSIFQVRGSPGGGSHAERQSDRGQRCRQHARRHRRGGSHLRLRPERTAERGQRNPRHPGRDRSRAAGFRGRAARRYQPPVHRREDRADQDPRPCHRSGRRPRRSSTCRPRS